MNKLINKKIAMSVENLISCEHYRKEDGSLIPVIDDVSFNIYENEITAISASNKEEIISLIEVLGNMRAYYKGRVMLSELGIKAIKRSIVENLFYVDSHKMVYDHMNVLEHMMYVSLIRDKKQEPTQLQKAMLDLIKICKLEKYVVSRIGKLDNSTKMVIAILIALLSGSTKVVINAYDYNFSYENCLQLQAIFDYFQKCGRTILVATKEPKLIGIACRRIIYISNGKLISDTEVDELNRTWDRVTCTMVTSNNEAFKNVLIKEMPNVEITIDDQYLVFRDCENEDILNKRVFDLAKDANVHIDFIRFNKGRVENAILELKERKKRDMNHDLHQ